jgi:lysophospholipase L1-like esterase
MPRLSRFALVPLFALTCLASAQADLEPARVAKWEKAVAAIEKRLKDAPPPADPVVFAGSSSIVRWDLKKSFPGRGYLNVGFGGSAVRDSAHFAHRLIGQLKPKTVVFYAGDNDIGADRTPEQVRDDFKAFVAAVRADAPKARVLFISVKPSLKRWKQFDAQTKANALVKRVVASDPTLGYIDVVPAMLGADGTPNPDLFVEDKLHLSPKGYEIWTAAVNKALAE